MRKLIIVFAILSLPASFTLGQLSEGGFPRTYKNQDNKSLKEIEGISLKIHGINKLLREEQQPGKPLSYSIYKTVNIDIKDKGTITETADGKIWQYKIESENAKSIGVFFSHYKLPANAKLFIYNIEKNKIFGAFTARNNKEKGHLAIADFPGNELIIEYFEPNNAEFEGSVVLGKIGQAFRDIYGDVLQNKAIVLYEVNCHWGDKVQLEKHSVAKMTWEEGQFGYQCTGNLINNVNSDGTPYFLTANHCISSLPAAENMITYFNYEKVGCGGITNEAQTLSGSTLKATYQPSDVTLLLLDDTPPKEYRPYYAGWNAESDSVIASASGIHHPLGQTKQVSLAYGEFFSYPDAVTWDDDQSSPANTHWILHFDIGETLGGSSGSALFDDNNRIVGQLHGGGFYDLYGKLSYSWNTSSNNAEKLKPYLDPGNTGTLVMDGYSPANNPVDAHPYSEFQQVCLNESVQLLDGSLFNPTSWNWSISPSTFVYLSGTDSTTQNPIVSFTENDYYTIALSVENASSSDEQIRTGYIRASNDLRPSIIISPEKEYKYYDMDSNMTVYGIGTESYSWEVTKGTDYIIIDSTTLETSILKFSRNDSVVIDSTYVINIQLTGSHGTCSSTVTDSIIIYYPFNDSIKNAYMLSLGVNGPFHNYRATVEDNEPNPPQGDCNTQSTWCGCEVSDTILERSVWFTFLGPASGIIGINAPGFDNQIAIYDADDYTDILSGNGSAYTILAANDDFFGEPRDYSSLIQPVEVTPGKLYWLQVDGSACGAMGEFTLELSDDNSLGTKDITNESSAPFSFYPVPASHYLNITSNTFTGDFIVKVFSVDGRDILQKSFENQSPGITNRIDLPASLNDGLYVVSVISEDFSYRQMVQVLGSGE